LDVGAFEKGVDRSEEVFFLPLGEPVDSLETSQKSSVLDEGVIRGSFPIEKELVDGDLQHQGQLGELLKGGFSSAPFDIGDVGLAGAELDCDLVLGQTTASSDGLEPLAELGFRHGDFARRANQECSSYTAW